MSEIIVVEKNVKKSVLDGVVLEKGDLVVIKSSMGEDYALVTTCDGNYTLTDLTNTLGNHWGKSFGYGTTVGEWSTLRGITITKVFKKGEYGLKLEV